MIVRAPATSANLGPGFDCAAVALDLWNELEVTEGEGVEVTGEGSGELPADETNLAVRAYALTADPAGMRFRFANGVPVGRGLGSSAAAIALGLAAARPDADPDELLELGSRLESHHDNLAAALLGGACLTAGWRAFRLADDLPLTPVAVIPEVRTATDDARRSLPREVSHLDAAFTAGRAAFLGAGLASGRADLLAHAFDDRLHEPYRPSPILDDVRDDPPPGSRGATLSGSGPTVIVWAEDGERCERALATRFPLARVERLAVSPRGAL